MQARRNLVWALGALLVIQFLHGLDELRTEEDATFFGTLADPGTILGVTGNVVALVAAVKGVSWAKPLAVATGVLVASASSSSTASPQRLTPPPPTGATARPTPSSGRA